MTARFRLAFIFLFLAASCHAKEAPLEGAVATLAGQPVSVADLRETARFMGVGGVADRPFTTWTPAFAKTVFEETIYDRLLAEAAQRQGISVSPKEIQEEKKRILAISAPEGGRPVELSEELVRKKLLLAKAAEQVAPAPEISRKAALAEYNRRKGHYETPERALVRDIVVRSEDEGKAILTALAAGNSFSALARAKSLSPEGAKGGLLPPYALGEMPALFALAFSMKPGEVSPLLSSPYGYHILKLVKILPSADLPFRKVRDRIERHLREKAQREALAQWLAGKIRTEHLTILPKYASTLSLPLTGP
uniref:Putative peptidyl-prolyl cis-trans isomerase n=1 Tax=Leptospirillum ferrodiazotrophum TaxID=412449 RepID=C6HVP7_9BACT|nr:MAG: putative peptidyl-prolyl cis-trans isomerase [Leptospirillum ferrodiazotrophum]